MLGPRDGPYESRQRLGPATLWTQIESFDLIGSTYLLGYEQDNGLALVAPFVGAASLGTAHQIGGWQTNWAEIASLSFM
jgi:hypothetical protein